MNIAWSSVNSWQMRGKRIYLFFFPSLSPRAVWFVLALMLASLGPATVSATSTYYVVVTTSAESGGVYEDDGDFQSDSIPVAVVTNNNLENPKARGFASAAAGPGSVAVVSNSKASGYAPSGQDTTGIGYNTAYFTVTDLIFTGPDRTVTTSLKLFWSGLMDHSVESLNANSYTNSNTTLDITGYIRRPAGTTFLSLAGYLSASKWQYGLDPQITDVSDSGILAGAYPPSGPLVTAQFDVPTGEHLTFKLSIATFSGTALLSTSVPAAAEGSATSKADFGGTVHLPASGPVFDLPEGFSVNSVEANIVDNEWTGTPVTAPLPQPDYCGDLGTVLLEADLFGDCYVGLADYAMFALEWRKINCDVSGWCNGADIDQNKMVGFSDLEMFVNQWLWCTDPLDLNCDVYWK